MLFRSEVQIHHSSRFIPMAGAIYTRLLWLRTAMFAWNVSLEQAATSVDTHLNLTVHALLASCPFWKSLQQLASMLSQFDNDHYNNRIRRSKSATSVKERRKHPIISAPLDPESSRVHAIIAAHRAMNRSQGSTEDLYRSDSSASKQSARFARGRYAANLPDPAARLQRQRSLLQATTPNLAINLPIPDSNNIARDSLQLSVPSRALAECGGNFEGEPSSYRRLRKAKSVLSPSHG